MRLVLQKAFCLVNKKEYNNCRRINKRNSVRGMSKTRADLVTLNRSSQKKPRLDGVAVGEVSVSELLVAELLAACRSTVTPHDQTAQLVLQRMEKTYSRAKDSYTHSSAFIDKVRELIEGVRQKPNQMWVMVKPLFDELKSYKQEKPKSGTAPTAKNGNNPTSNGNEAIASAQPQEETKQSDSDTATPVRGQASERQILRLEKLLAEFHKEIEKYELKELSLDDLDDEDNDYLICERLKRRASKIFHRLCELKDRTAGMGGRRERKFKYSGSRYKEVNLHTEKLINKQSPDERMPDYADIRKLVKKCDEKYVYRLSRTLMDQEAKHVFIEVAAELSNIRKKDFAQDFGPANATRALVSELEDPATYSSSLKDKLKKNQIVAQENLTQELDKWAQLQTKDAEKKQSGGAAAETETGAEVEGDEGESDEDDSGGEGGGNDSGGEDKSDEEGEDGQDSAAEQTSNKDETEHLIAQCEQDLGDRPTPEADDDIDGQTNGAEKGPSTNGDETPSDEDSTTTEGVDQDGAESVQSFSSGGSSDDSDSEGGDGKDTEEETNNGAEAKTSQHCTVKKEYEQEAIVIPDSQDEPEEEQITEEEVIPAAGCNKPEIIELLDSD